MSFDARRGAVVALGVLAVALGGALFPAAGVGSVPGGSPVESGPGSGPGAVETAETPSSGTATATPTATPTTTRAETSATNPTPTATDTPTPTSTPTRTPTPFAEESLPYEPYIEALLWLGLIVVSVGSIAAFLSVVGGSSDTPDGDPPVAAAAVDRAVENAIGIAPSRVVARIPQVTMVVLVGFSTSTARALGTAGSLLSDVTAGFGVVAGGSWSATAGLFSGLGKVVANPPSLSGSLVSVPGLLGALTASGVGRDAAGSPSADARHVADADPAESDDDFDPTTIEEAWVAFADDLPVRDPETMTARESAGAAVEAGYPPEPVYRLTRIFEAVRYGDGSRTQDRIDAAIAAARTIEEHREDNEE